MKFSTSRFRTILLSGQYTHIHLLPHAFVRLCSCAAADFDHSWALLSPSPARVFPPISTCCVWLLPFFLLNRLNWNFFSITMSSVFLFIVLSCWTFFLYERFIVFSSTLLVYSDFSSAARLLLFSSSSFIVFLILLYIFFQYTSCSCWLCLSDAAVPQCGRFLCFFFGSMCVSWIFNFPKHFSFLS